MFLSQNEIIELTGYKYYKKQIKWLIYNKIKHLVGIDGKPKVLISHIENELGSNNKNSLKKLEPDFSIFKNRVF